VLQADDLAGLNEGAPLWYKGLQVGQIRQLTLDGGGNASVAAGERASISIC
jgi:ABC-type transporter Mla subunit MlaD